jgi:type IV pilus assembly protein PilB
MEEHVYVDELTNILLKTQALEPELAKGLAEAFANSSHERFDDFLLEEGLVDKAGLLKALSILYQVPYMDVEGYFFDSFLLHKFPKDFLIRNAIIPYQQDENMLLVVAADPSDSELLDKIGAHVSYDIRFNVGIYTDIITMIRMYYDTSLTEPVDEDKELHREDQALRIQELNDLPVSQEEQDESAFIKQKIDQFVAHETESEKKEIEERAHNAQKKR